MVLAGRRLTALEFVCLVTAALTAVVGIAEATRRPAFSLRGTTLGVSDLPRGYATKSSRPDGQVHECRPSALVDRAHAINEKEAEYQAIGPLRDLVWSATLFASEQAARDVMHEIRVLLRDCDGFDSASSDETVHYEYTDIDPDDPLGFDSIYVLARASGTSVGDVQTHGYVARRGPVLVNLRAQTVLLRGYNMAPDTDFPECVTRLVFARYRDPHAEGDCRSAERYETY